MTESPYREIIGQLVRGLQNTQQLHAEQPIPLEHAHQLHENQDFKRHQQRLLARNMAEIITGMLVEKARPIVQTLEDDRMSRATITYHVQTRVLREEDFQLLCNAVELLAREHGWSDFEMSGMRKP